MIRKIALVLSLLGLGAGQALAFQQVTDFDQSKSNPGNLKMYLHIPQQLRDPAPLVLALHGCTQSANAYHTESGWSELADRYGFYVVYPEQNSEDKTAKTGNPYSCFNWAGYYGEGMAKGEGENGSIKQMVEYMQERYHVDAGKVYITGLSAGGGMTTMMLALYPEVFAGGAPMAGIPYKCASNVDQAYGCMGVTSSFQPRTGAGCESGEACMDPALRQSAETWAARVRAGNGNWQGQYPRVIIWQGDKDQYVADENAVELMKQWTAVHGTDQTADTEGQQLNGSSKHSYREYRKDGRALVAVVDLLGMKHGISVDPGTGEDQGGKPGLAMSYTFDWDVHSAYYTAQWWGLIDSSDSPLVEVLEPAEGAHLQGVVSVQAQASDEDGIAEVAFYLDGALLERLYAAPYTMSFDADALADGEHTLRVVATEAHADAKTGERSVRFSTGNDLPVVGFTSPSDGATLSGNMEFRVQASDRDGIAYVDFFLDDGQSERQLERAAAAPDAVTIDTSALADGSYSVRAVAVDASAQALSSEARLSFETGFDCQQWTAYNYSHALAGRARNVSALWWYPDYRVVGSGEKLGNSSWVQTTVHSTAAEGSYALGACP